jgi:hypothetical protein
MPLAGAHRFLQRALAIGEHLGAELASPLIKVTRLMRYGEQAGDRLELS